MQQQGMEVKSLKNRPILNQWVSEYWQAFQLLSASRLIHQGGVGSIPLSEIVAYMNTIYLRDVDERLRFITMIQSLDSVYVTHLNEKARKRAENAQRSRPRK